MPPAPPAVKGSGFCHHRLIIAGEETTGKSVSGRAKPAGAAAWRGKQRRPRIFEIRSGQRRGRICGNVAPLVQVLVDYGSAGKRVLRCFLRIRRLSRTGSMAQVRWHHNIIRHYNVIPAKLTTIVIPTEQRCCWTGVAAGTTWLRVYATFVRQRSGYVFF